MSKQKPNTDRVYEVFRGRCIVVFIPKTSLHSRLRRGAVRYLPAGSTRLMVPHPPVSFVDRAGVAPEVHPVESCNGRSGRTALRHLYKPKAVRMARLKVDSHFNRVHSTIRLEELAEVLIRYGARKVANKNVHTKVLRGSVLSRPPEYAHST
jgi:hypothetical protein